MSIIRKPEANQKQLEHTTRQKPRLTVRQQQIKRDIEMWENNLLARSGIVAFAGELETDFEAETDENRVSLLLHK